MSDLDPLSLVTAELTDTGSVRTNNQDACAQFADPARGMHLLVVADGMGGHLGGAEASRIAVTSMGEAFRRGGADPEELLRDAFNEANARVFEAAAANPELAGMGTTGVVLLFPPERRVWVAHVGDSRAYRLRKGRFEQLTQDHSVVEALLRMGQITEEEARDHPQRNEILRAIGTQKNVRAEITCLETQPGDRYLLCSDGLSGMVSDSEIARVLGRQEPAAAVQELVRLANEEGGTDNITVQIAALPEGPPPEEKTEETKKKREKPEERTEGEKRQETEDGRPSWLFWAFGLGILALLGWLLLGRM